MKWPWVSRERLAEAQKRLDAADAERVRLLNLLLLSERQERRREAVGLPTEWPAKEDGNASVSASVPARPVEAFSTPFDRMERRFAQTFPQGAKIPAKFMARVN